MTNEDLLRLQEKEVEIFSQVINAINRMGLTYYCIGGTAIGAIKYHGFVPWDDDIDIALPRNDFMEFINKGQGYLPKNLFISSCYTEKEYFIGVAKVRDSDTSFFDIETENYNVNHGIFIDIFPIDIYVKPSFRKRFLTKILLGRISFRNKNQPFVAKAKSFICSLLCFFKSPNKCRIKLDKMLMENSSKNSTKIFNREMVFERDVFGKPIEGVFSGLSVMLPEKIDEYLKMCFGDITKDVPLEKQISHHFASFISTKNPYKDYEYHHGQVRKKK